MRVIGFVFSIATTIVFASGCVPQNHPTPTTSSVTEPVTVVTPADKADPPPKTDASEPVKEKEQETEPPVTSPSSEDPEVAEYIKAKGWTLANDVRISDLKRLKYLVVENRAKPFDDLVLTTDDYKMIARSKTVQELDLRKVKTTDDGLKIVAGIPQLEGIIVRGEDVTDAGIKAISGSKSIDTVSLIETKKVTDAGLKALAALPKLKTLTLMFITIDGSVFEAFAGSKTLTSVTLYVDGFTDAGAKHLAKVPNLNVLDIRGGFGESPLTAAGIKSIVDVRLPPKFEFNKKLLDDALLEVLVAKGWLYGPTAPGFRKRPATPEDIKEISLGGSRVTDKGFAVLLNCTNATSLSLDETGITDETLKKVAGFTKLRSLFLKKTKITATGLEAVSGLPLRYLTLEQCEMTEEMFKAIGKTTVLEELHLSHTKLKPEWFNHLAALPKLKELDVYSTAFDDAAAKEIAKLPNIQKLTCNYSQMGDVGFLELVKLPKMTQMYLDGSKVTKDVFLKAKKDYPKVFMMYYGYDK